MAKVSRLEPNGCWAWTAYRSRAGYGRFVYQGKAIEAHRVSYELFVGRIPEGLEIDHKCANRACVNPNHLRAVTHKENVLAPWSQSRARLYSLITHCPKGHEYTKDNTVPSSSRGGRKCRQCVYQRGVVRAQRAKKDRAERRAERLKERLDALEKERSGR